MYGLNHQFVRGLIGLLTLQGVGPLTVERLIRHFGSPHEALKATSTEIMGLSWLSSLAKKSLKRGVDQKRLDACIHTLERLGAWALCREDYEFPNSLKEIYNPPPILFGLGDSDLLNEKSVAIVGARRATRYGQEVAKNLAGGLSSKGLAVVSGMALGIDTSAHRGALGAGGKTIAVLGSGLDRPYPARNRGLMKEIAESGAVITEFLPGTNPEPGNFPRRNRIICGLSQGVVVVEAGLKSGSLITASLALEQGKEVMAVPGSVRSPVSKGTHWLIKQGAFLVEDSRDVLEVLGLDTEAKGYESKKRITVDDPRKRRVLGSLGPYPVFIDDIIAATGLEPGEVSAILLDLELEGLVEALPGKFFQIGAEAGS